MRYKHFQKGKNICFSPIDNSTSENVNVWPYRYSARYICVAPLAEWKMFNIGFSRHENNLGFAFLWRYLWRQHLINTWFLLKGFLLFFTSEKWKFNIVSCILLLNLSLGSEALLHVGGKGAFCSQQFWFYLDFPKCPYYSNQRQLIGIDLG